MSTCPSADSPCIRYKDFSKKFKPFIFKILALMETYTWDVTHMDMAKGWIASWEGGRWKVMEPLGAPGHKHKDNEQLPGRPGTDSCRERIQEQMWWWRQLGCFPVFSICMCWSPSSFPLHHSVSPSSLNYFYSLLLFSGTFLICPCFRRTQHGFSLFHQFFSFFAQLCSLSVPA